MRTTELAQATDADAGSAAQSRSPPVAVATTRLAGLDVLRGLMLTIVLADHCGGMLTQGRFIRQWTLMGLGWSDAAEGFVFVSGFTFGWVYAARIERHGVWRAVQQGLLRTLELYLAYLVTVIGVAILAQLQVQQGTLSSAAAIADAQLMDAFLLCHHPYATAILCLYIVCLPITLVTFVIFGRDKSWFLLLSSYCCYVLAQLFPALNLRTEHGVWFFNPFAWQVLMIVGAILGRESQAGRTLRLPTIAMHRVAITVMCAVVATSFLFQKRILLSDSQTVEWFGGVIEKTQWHHEWLGKTTLAPLRLLHFTALAYLLSAIVPLRSGCWSHWALTPLRICGRQSLTVYCIGVLLTHSLRLVPPAWSSTPLEAASLVATVCTIQFLLATLLDRKWKAGNPSFS